MTPKAFPTLFSGNASLAAREGEKSLHFISDEVDPPLPAWAPLGIIFASLALWALLWFTARALAGVLA